MIHTYVVSVLRTYIVISDAYLYFVNFIQDVQQFTTVAELEEFMIEHGEQVLDVLGSEVDRIEKDIKVHTYVCMCYTVCTIIF